MAFLKEFLKKKRFWKNQQTVNNDPTCRKYYCWPVFLISCLLTYSIVLSCVSPMYHVITYITRWAYNTIRALTRENLSSGVCKQQRLTPAYAYAQSDQRLCYSFIGMYHIETCFKQNFIFLASLCRWAGWFESHCWKPRKQVFLRHVPYTVQSLYIDLLQFEVEQI